MPAPLLRRVTAAKRPIVHFTLDGQALEAMEGDTVLTALLLNGARLRQSEFGDGPRAGFCLMGACQDCWVRTEDNSRLRACAIFIAEGMRLCSSPGGTP